MDKYIYIAMSLSGNGNRTPRKAFDTDIYAQNYIESITHEEWYEDEQGEEYCNNVDDNGFIWYVQPVERG